MECVSQTEALVSLAAAVIGGISLGWGIRELLFKRYGR